MKLRTPTQSVNRDYRIVPTKRRLAVLASGGLDSSVMLAELASSGREVFPVYVRAGLMWERHELGALRSYIRRLKLRSINPVNVLLLPMGDVAGGHWSMTGRKVPGYRAAVSSNYILGRNLSLLAKAAIFCAYNRIGEIAMAPLESNPFPDARPEFFRALERAIDLGVGLKLKILTPYVGMTKGEVIRRGANLPLRFTVTCARPEGITHCGRCTKCAERIEGFREAGVPDPTEYAHRPPPRG
jgi:7-cyano-7-deazaguanine synthase